MAAVFVVDADYLATGTLAEYSRDSGFFSLQTERQRQTRVGDAIRASLMKPALSGDVLKRAYTPVRRVNRLVMNTQGAIQPNDDAAGLGSFGVFYVLLMSIFFSAGFLQQATGEDRQNAHAGNSAVVARLRRTARRQADGTGRARVCCR